jgi:hypothetical protein
MQRPAATAILQNELAFYLIRAQENAKMFDRCKTQNIELHRQIAACSVNNRYREAIRLEHQLTRVLDKRQHLRMALSQTRIAFEHLKLYPLLLDSESTGERVRLRRNSEKHIELLRAKERLDTRPTKRRSQFENFFSQIEELNDRMKTIGLEKEMVDVGKLRERINVENSQKEIEWSDDEMVKPKPPLHPAQKPTARRRARGRVPERVAPVVLETEREIEKAGEDNGSFVNDFEENQNTAVDEEDNMERQGYSEEAGTETEEAGEEQRDEEQDEVSQKTESQEGEEEAGVTENERLPEGTDDDETFDEFGAAFDD